MRVRFHPHPSLSQWERVIKQKSYGRVHRSLNNKDEVDLWTVIRRTAIREVSSSIWNDKKRGGAKDELRHAVRSFLRICLIAKRVYTVRAKCVKVYIQDCSAYP